MLFNKTILYVIVCTNLTFNSFENRKLIIWQQLLVGSWCVTPGGGLCDWVLYNHRGAYLSHAFNIYSKCVKEKRAVFSHLSDNLSITRRTPSIKSNNQFVSTLIYTSIRKNNGKISNCKNRWMHYWDWMSRRRW